MTVNVGRECWRVEDGTLSREVAEDVDSIDGAVCELVETVSLGETVQFVELDELSTGSGVYYLSEMDPLDETLESTRAILWKVHDTISLLEGTIKAFVEEVRDCTDEVLV
jgi:hypothetical protein